VTYNVVDEIGWYLNISGPWPAEIQTRPGLLTTTNPFYFQGKWAERNHDRYYLFTGDAIGSCNDNPDKWEFFAANLGWFETLKQERVF